MEKSTFSQEEIKEATEGLIAFQQACGNLLAVIGMESKSIEVQRALGLCLTRLKPPVVNDGYLVTMMRMIDNDRGIIKSNLTRLHADDQFFIRTTINRIPDTFYREQALEALQICVHAGAESKKAAA
jgi:hypothetical protein